MSNFYCASPWRGLHINIRGDVKTCCAGNPNMLGNLNTKTITEILNGPELTEIRSVLRQGQPHAYCQGCVTRESKGAPSEREWHNKINKSFDTTQAGLEYEYPALLDIRWNSTCNLSCNYCGPPDSSKWAALKKIPVNNNTKKYYQDVCDFIEQHNQHVQEVALVGGEPLLLPENERLLDVIPADAVITIITNLNNPLENNRIFQKLTQRQRVGWSISFDNIGNQFEYVRYGAKWDLQLHNLDLVQDLMKNNGHWGGIHAVYNLYNATRLVEFKQFAISRGLSIKWQNLGVPEALDPRCYGQEIAQLAAAEIERMFATCDVNQEERLLFGTALNLYKSKTQPNPNMLNQLQKFVTEIEQYHPDQLGQFARLWPELSNLL
jgi:sulfatase maturation enzyme AslB (radical SAM superfamily)